MRACEQWERLGRHEQWEQVGISPPLFDRLA